MCNLHQGTIGFVLRLLMRYARYAICVGTSYIVNRHRPYTVCVDLHVPTYYNSARVRPKVILDNCER